MLRSKTYLILLGLFLWVWMANAVTQTNFLLYLKYVVHHEDQIDGLLVGLAAHACRIDTAQATLLTCSFIGLPFWYWLIQKYGKRKVYIVGLIVRCDVCV